jgi:hypothetical protein
MLRFGCPPWPEYAVFCSLSTFSDEKLEKEENAASRIDLLWKARALQAKERIAAFHKKQEAKPLNATDQCALEGEVAFEARLEPTLATSLSSRSGEKSFQSLVFFPRNWTKGAAYTHFTFAYPPAGERPIGVTVLGLAKGDRIGFFNGEVVALNHEDCNYTISLQDPLNLSVEPMK